MSSLTLYEQFVGINWARYSQVASKITCVCCAVIPVISFFFGFSVVELLTLFCKALFCYHYHESISHGHVIYQYSVGSILAIWEYPSVYILIPEFERIKGFTLDNLYMKLEESKAVLYFLMSIICLSYTSLCIIPGICLLLSSILMAFAAINRRVDSLDASSSSQPPYIEKVVQQY